MAWISLNLLHPGLISIWAKCTKSAEIAKCMNAAIFGNFTTGFSLVFQEIGMDCMISRDYRQWWENWADFVQFTVNFGSSIFHGLNWKMVCKFCVIFQIGGAFWLL